MLLQNIKFSTIFVTNDGIRIFDFKIVKASNIFMYFLCLGLCKIKQNNIFQDSPTYLTWSMFNIT